MDMPKNIKPADFKTTEANIPKLTHHEDFVMRMFFIRYPKKTSWHMCLYLLQEETESINYTRWPAYYGFDKATLVGEMESILADLKQEFTSVHANPPAPTPTRDPDTDLDAWGLITRTINPLPTQTPRFNLKK